MRNAGSATCPASLSSCCRVAGSKPVAFSAAGFQAEAAARSFSRAAVSAASTASAGDAERPTSRRRKQHMVIVSNEPGAKAPRCCVVRGLSPPARQSGGLLLGEELLDRLLDGIGIGLAGADLDQAHVALAVDHNRRGDAAYHVVAVHLLRLVLVESDDAVIEFVM